MDININKLCKLHLFLTSSDNTENGHISTWSSGNHSGNDAYNSMGSIVYVNASVGDEFALTYHNSYTTGNQTIEEYSSFGAMLIG